MKNKQDEKPNTETDGVGHEFDFEQQGISEIKNPLN